MGADEARQKWLEQARSRVPTDEHYEVAEAIAHNRQLSDDQRTLAEDFVPLKLLLKNPNGSFVPVDPDWIL